MLQIMANLHNQHKIKTSDFGYLFNEIQNTTEYALL